MRKKILAGILAIATLSTCALLAVACSNDNEETANVEQTQTGIGSIENTFSTEFVNTKNIKLMAATPMMANAENSVSQTLVATITPSTATNRKVDWSIAWLDATAAGNKKVTDYVTVTPQSEGSLMATVTCYAAFEHDILITVTTREGGFQADCIVTFTGFPDSISISSSVLTPVNGNIYGLGVGIEYDFDINLNNVFGVVGEKYHDYTVGVQATGTLTVGTLEDDPRASAGVWYSERTANLSEFTDKILSYSIEDDVLHVKFNKSIEGFYSSMVRNGSVKTYYDRVKSVDSPCSFLIQVNVKEIGVSFNARINVVIDSTVVTGVEMTPTMEF